MIRASNDFIAPGDAASVRARLGSAAVLTAALPGLVVSGDGGISGEVRLDGERGHHAVVGHGMARGISSHRFVVDWSTDEPDTRAPSSAVLNVVLSDAGPGRTRVDVDVAMSDDQVPAGARGAWSDAAFRAIAAVGAHVAAVGESSGRSVAVPQGTTADGPEQEPLTAYLGTQPARLAMSAAAGVAVGAAAAWLRRRRSH